VRKKGEKRRKKARRGERRRGKETKRREGRGRREGLTTLVYFRRISNIEIQTTHVTCVSAAIENGVCV
jgi:hypothetical protein